MPTFAFAGRTRAGELVNGERLADSVDAAVAMLRREQILVTKISAVRERAKEDKSQQKFRAKKVPSKSLAIFTRQFSVMIDAGLPLVQCLQILGQQEPHKGFAQVILATRAEVEGGASLADAMRRHPKAFDTLYVNMVAAGEAGGILDTILLRLATFLEKNDALVRKVKGAMVYPGVIITVAMVAIAVLLIFVIPTFESMFASAGMELPLPTRVVIGMSNALINYWWMAILAVGVVIFAIRQYYNTPDGRKQIDGMLLKAPVLGDLLRKSAVSRFTRTLGTLVSSGVSILDGLEITAKTAGNRVIHDAVMESRQSIAGGETIAAPLEKSKVFPPMVISMIAVGEQTGGLDEMLTKIADFYDEEVDVAVSALLSLMEPAMIVILGVIVGGMVIAMYLPIFDMMNAVQ
jgi:type IV pilus assembly protein PilC